MKSRSSSPIRRRTPTSGWSIDISPLRITASGGASTGSMRPATPTPTAISMPIATARWLTAIAITSSLRSIATSRSIAICKSNSPATKCRAIARRRRSEAGDGRTVGGHPLPPQRPGRHGRKRRQSGRGAGRPLFGAGRRRANLRLARCSVSRCSAPAATITSSSRSRRRSTTSFRRSCVRPSTSTTGSSPTTATCSRPRPQKRPRGKKTSSNSTPRSPSCGASSPIGPREHRPRGDVLFEDHFDAPEQLTALWSNTAPGDDAPGGARRQ